MENNSCISVPYPDDSGWEKGSEVSSILLQVNAFEYVCSSSVWLNCSSLTVSNGKPKLF